MLLPPSARGEMLSRALTHEGMRPKRHRRRKAFHQDLCDWRPFYGRRLFRSRRTRAEEISGAFPEKEAAQTSLVLYLVEPRERICFERGRWRVRRSFLAILRGCVRIVRRRRVVIVESARRERSSGCAARHSSRRRVHRSAVGCHCGTRHAVCARSGSAREGYPRDRNRRARNIIQIDESAPRVLLSHRRSQA